jgi:hypothetical protein
LRAKEQRPFVLFMRGLLLVGVLTGSQTSESILPCWIKEDTESILEVFSSMLYLIKPLSSVILWRASFFCNPLESFFLLDSIF